jgi:hypothetical protein
VRIVGWVLVVATAAVYAFGLLLIVAVTAGSHG